MTWKFTASGNKNLIKKEINLRIFVGWFLKSSETWRSKSIFFFPIFTVRALKMPLVCSEDEYEKVTVFFNRKVFVFVSF